MNNFDNLKNKTAAVVLNGEKYNGKIDGDIIVGVDGGCDRTERVDIFVGDKDTTIHKNHHHVFINVNDRTVSNYVFGSFTIRTTFCIFSYFNSLSENRLV